MIPWQLLDSAPVPGGAETLRLYRRGAELGAILTDRKVDLVTFFLKSTTGKQPLVTHPVLPSPTDSTPQPQLQ